MAARREGGFLLSEQKVASVSGGRVSEGERAGRGQRQGRSTGCVGLDPAGRTLASVGSLFLALSRRHVADTLWLLSGEYQWEVRQGRWVESEAAAHRAVPMRRLDYMRPFPLPKRTFSGKGET